MVILLSHSIKNHTHVKKVGHTPEFLFVIEKQLFIKKNVEVGQ